MAPAAAGEKTSLIPKEDEQQRPSRTSLTSLFERPSSTAQIRTDSESTRRFLARTKSDHDDDRIRQKDEESDDQQTPRCTFCTCSEISSTLIGSFTFLLYHVIFCLAQAATITRPHASHSTTGLMAKTAALGVLTAGPCFVYQINTINAIYPTSDLFLAPFLAHLANDIDQVLFEHGLENDDRIFLATFGIMSSVAFLLSGGMCVLAARFKLANLGAFLPYSVLCGFFTAIGLLIWSLGFNVDTGMTVGQVVTSRDWNVIKPALIHHAPSLIIGVAMHIFGYSSPFFVIFLVFGTVAGFYVILFVTGTTLQEAQAANWLYSADDLTWQQETSLTFKYGPPAPFGIVASLFHGEVFWKAAKAGIPVVLALAFLYLIRCSVQSAALRKNVSNVTRKAPEPPSPVRGQIHNSEVVPKRMQPPSLGFILEHGYGYSQFVAALTGGIAVSPAIAASLTLFKLGAEKKAPQYGSCFLILAFYLTDFRLVEYIPKPAFSCLMVLAGIDMCRTWLIGSFRKTKDKMEWMVAPFLVVMAFAVGMLNAIFLGIAVSTFIFAANSYRAGTVKFVGTGLTLHSPVERGAKEMAWLNRNADLIQILVLQNYLFFGNAQSVLEYVATMFDEAVSSNAEYYVPPIPKYLIVDFTMVSGLDISAIDSFREVVEMCKEHNCRLLLAGLNPNLKSKLVYAGFKPASGSSRFVYVSDLESALARAEDGLFSGVFHLEDKEKEESSDRRQKRSQTTAEDGFGYALKKIDELHGLNVAQELSGLSKHTVAIELKAGEILLRDTERDQGLYFVETGLMRLSHPTGHSTTLNTLPEDAAIRDAPTNNSDDPTLSLGHLNARSGKLGRQLALWKNQGLREHVEQTFHLARIGQGWVIGDIEESNGIRNPGVYVAITDCLLHHLPHGVMEKTERADPTLAMKLYKLLSYLSTKRQETTIRQLGQFVRILHSPTPSLNGGKDASGSFQVIQRNNVE